MTVYINSQVNVINLMIQDFGANPETKVAGETGYEDAVTRALMRLRAAMAGGVGVSRLIPAGGTDDQVLRKVGTTDYATEWSDMVWRRRSGVAVSLTGTTAETILMTATLPAGLMKANGVITIDALWSTTTSANNKTLRARLGGIGGTGFLGAVVTTNVSVTSRTIIHNRNNQASQVGMSTSHRGGDSIQQAQTLVTTTVDTSVEQTLVLTGQLALGSETMALEAALVRVWPKS